MNQEGFTIFARQKRLGSQACEMINSAVSHHMEGQVEEAATLYNVGIKLAEQALQMDASKCNVDDLTRKEMSLFLSKLDQNMREATAQLSMLRGQAQSTPITPTINRAPPSVSSKPSPLKQAASTSEKIRSSTTPDKIRTSSTVKKPSTTSSLKVTPTIVKKSQITSPSIRATKTPTPSASPVPNRTTTRPSTTSSRTPITPIQRKTMAQSPVTTSSSQPGAKPAAEKTDANLEQQIMETLWDGSNPTLWEDISGLDQAKKNLMEMIINPALRPDLFTGLRAPHKGLLLFGPPGNGKTYIAKAIATKSKANFFSISASSVTSKWLGESEKLMKGVFSKAREMQPSIIFIDEIDSLLRSRSSSENESTRRIKTEFMVQFSNLTEADRVYIMGATNKPDEIDEAARRRFTLRIYIPLPDHQTRCDIVRHLLSKDKNHKMTSSDIMKVAQLTDRFSAADLTDLCKDAAMNPLRSFGENIPSNIRIQDLGVSFGDFKVSLSNRRPSVGLVSIPFASSRDPQIPYEYLDYYRFDHQACRLLPSARHRLSVSPRVFTIKLANRTEGQKQRLRRDDVWSQAQMGFELRELKDQHDASPLDPEKEAPKTNEFNLREYFENSVRTYTEEGNRPKRVGVSVKNLTVVGRGANQSVISDLTSPFRYVMSSLNPFSWLGDKEKVETVDILHDVSTFCRDGEMLLVLGRPGAGCSTLLRLMSNARHGYVEVNGSVSYAGIDSRDFSPYRGQAIYTPEEDAHWPTLTVRQTLDFALKTKTPRNLASSETKRQFRTRTTDLLLKMFGMTKQADTVIGNEWLRGLSGGERKRMTIMEAMVSSPAVCCWDCPSRGLDAASALDYVKSLRVMTDTMKKTTVVSLYQASESMYDLFDKVVVLEKGRVIYFGPTQSAKEYFVSMGFQCEARKSTPDFLTGVTNFQERLVRPGYEEKAPTTSFQFETVWKGSEECKRQTIEQREYEEKIEEENPMAAFREQIKAEKSRGSREGSIYTIGFLQQVFALITRQAQLVWMDKIDLVFRYVSTIVLGLIYGSVFVDLSDGVGGPLSRGGAIFCVMLFNAFTSQTEMANVFVGRRILQKQKSYAMYHPSAFHIAQVFMDLPVQFIQVSLFSVITYFMWQLGQSAGQFFVFNFAVWIFTLSCCNLFRLLGNISPSIYVSNQLLLGIFVTLICYSGFLLPRPKMKPWLGWIYWINPFAYTFKGLYANEMRGKDFYCDDGLIPYGPNYNDPAYQTCTLPGSSPGSTTVSGEQFIRMAYDIDIDQQAVNIIAVFLFWLLFTAINMVCMEFVDFTGGGYTHKVYKRGKAPPKNTEEMEREQQRRFKEATDTLDETLTLRGGVFMWKDVRYTVQVKGRDKLLLDDVEGWIKPGQMTALMGSSGAGKTTLLDVLAKRKTTGRVSGVIRLNGKPLQMDFERITGYVEQMDVHNPNVTVRESLLFSARLRQEKSVPDEEKIEYVEKILTVMEMSHLGEALIGNLETGVGLSIEERKRLTIGMELVAKPHILFLDEPTSGLDAQSSYNIIQFTRRLADAGMPLVCTVHQPSSVLFEHFDRLILLARGGRVAYFGDIGPRSSTLTRYLTERGVRACTEEENPAEYMLEAIGAGVNGSTDKDWPELWLQSKERREVVREIEDMMQREEKDDDERGAKEFSTDTLYQFLLVYRRLNIIFWRDPYYNFGRLVQALIVGLLNGFSYWQLGSSSSDLQLRIFLVFQAVVLGVLLIFSSMPVLQQQKMYYQRDFSSKYYSWLPFALSIVLVEIPYLILAGTISMLCFYWSASLDSTAHNGFYFWIAYVLLLFYCVTLGQAIAAICQNLLQAIMLEVIAEAFLFLFCGVLQPPSQLPTFWRSWMYPLNPFRYIMEGLVTDVLMFTRVTCSSEDLLVYQPPPGQTCGQYSAEFLSISPGYVNNPTSTENCGYCTYEKGSDFYDSIPMSAEHRWRDFGIFSVYWVFNVFLIVLFVYLARKPSR
ncbi:hypothetical protein PROFUN_07374 [Planoprotostelium fungivorum]|uniref:ABC transporter domain-containing protein n=1 Tax=Planoprotostelium fungivorum TaxID=1890364 RepID=A0A2P6MTE4_9EUKA|nr:hypothetical protein PROFUN_07374 [Planoprotostelium fungivorum]